MGAAKFLFRVDSKNIVKNLIIFHFLFFEAWVLILII